MQEPRFFVESVDELIELASRADPPVRTGEIAELALPRRRVRVQVKSVGAVGIVWEEIE